MDIKVNDTQWNGLSDEEQQNIKAIITQIFKEKHQIVPEKNLASASAVPLGSFCTFACDAAQTLAETACNAIPNPIGKQLCIAAAKQAGDFCRSKC